MNAVFDTNYFLTKGDHYDVLQRVLFSKPPICRLVLDLKGTIKKEYFEALAKYPQSAVLRQICQRVSERQGPQVAMLDGTLCTCLEAHDQQSDACDLAELERLGCGEEIEPSIFGIARKNPMTLVFLLHGALNRGYIDQWDVVSARYLTNQSTLKLEMYRKISYPTQRYPATPAQLEDLLNEYRIVGRRTEQDLLENKEGPLDFVTFRDGTFERSLRTRIAEAVRGMLNSRSGWVFVGIDSVGEIIGFPPSYRTVVGHVNPVEQVQELISQDIRSIVPNPLEVDPECVALWPIDIGNGRIVVTILITKPKGNITFSYHGTVHGRLGATTPRLTRTC